MRRLLNFLFLVLTTVTCTAQQVNVTQLRPSATNGQVVTTVAGVSQWASPNINNSFRLNYTVPAAGQYVFLTPTSCGVAATGGNTAGSGSCAPDGGSLSISGSNIGGTNQVNMAGTWGFTLPSYVNQANISAVYLAYGIGFSYAGIAEDVTGGSCSDGHSASATFASGGSQVLIWGTNVTTFNSVPLVNSLTCSVGASGSGYIVPGKGGYLSLGASVGLFVYYTGSAPPPSPALVNVAPPLAYQSGLLYLPLPYDAGYDVASTNAYVITIPALNNILGGQQLTAGVGVTLVASNANTSTTPTLNVNGTGALPIQKGGAALVSGDIAAGEPARLYFDGANWQLSNPVHPASSGVTSVSNSDSSLTISPTTGAVVASLNIGHGNTWTANQTFNGGFDASGATQIKLPVAAGYASAANGEVGYDSTNKNWHMWGNGVDNILALFPVASPPADTNCAQWSVTGGVYTLGHTTGACGTGSGGDTITSPNGTLIAGGTSTNTTLDVAPVNTVVDTSTPVTVSTAKPAEFHFNENSTAATAITYNLPTAAAGKQFCFSNAYNGSAANTGTLELLTSASGQFIIFTDGTLSATGGYVISGGAAADAACLVGVDSTHWFLYVQGGTWTKH